MSQKFFISTVIVTLLFSASNVFAFATPLDIEQHNKNIPENGGYLITEKELERYTELYNTQITTGVWENDNDREFYVSIEEKFDKLTPEQLLVYKEFSDEQCLNILVNTGSAGMVYNGEYIEGTNMGLVDKVHSVHIAGNRVAYIDNRFSDGSHVIVDGVDYGLTGQSGRVAGPDDLELTEDHVAFAGPVFTNTATGEGEQHLIFDGKDLGLLDHFSGGWSGSRIKIRGDDILFPRMIDGKTHIFLNEEDKGEGIMGDFDGQNLAIIREIPKPDSYFVQELVYNGQVIKSLTYRESDDDQFWRVITHNGHLAYETGPGHGFIGYEPFYVYFDGKELEPHSFGPIFEKDHFSYNVWTWDETYFIYDDEKYESFVESNQPVLAGDHIAVVKSEPFYKDSTTGETKLSPKVHIDGTIFPGNPIDVQITEKPNCTPKKKIGKFIYTQHTPFEKKLDAVPVDDTPKVEDVIEAPPETKIEEVLNPTNTPETITEDNINSIDREESEIKDISQTLKVEEGPPRKNIVSRFFGWITSLFSGLFGK